MRPGATSRPMKQAAAGDSYNALALALGWAGYCDSTLQFDSPQFTELAELWQNLRGDAALPKREAMTARRLKDLLPAIALYESCGFEKAGLRNTYHLMVAHLAVAPP